MPFRSLHRRLLGRPELLLVSLVLGSILLTSCSEMILVLARHDCPTPVAVTIVDDWYEQAPQKVAPGVDTEIYGICCEPGQDGELIVSSGEWTESIAFDRLRDDPVVVLPPQACTAP